MDRKSLKEIHAHEHTIVAQLHQNAQYENRYMIVFTKVITFVLRAITSYVSSTPYIIIWHK